MATRRVKCEGSLFMESVFAKMQEIYTHVEFLSYDRKFLPVAYLVCNTVRNHAHALLTNTFLMI